MNKDVNQNKENVNVSHENNEVHDTKANHSAGVTQEMDVNQRDYVTHQKIVDSEEQSLIRETGRIITGAFYDYQQLRLMNYNRIRDVIRKKAEGISFNEVEDKKEEKSYDKEYNDKALRGKFEELIKDGKLTEKEQNYIGYTMDLLEASEALENQYKRRMTSYIEEEPVWTEWLGKTIMQDGKEVKCVKGVSTILTANLLKNYGYCENYSNVAKLWSHSGLSVVDGEAPKRKKGEVISYNPQLKVLAWKLGDSFIKQNTYPYRQVYDTEKARQVARMEKGEAYDGEGSVPKSLMHCHRRAMRKMVKIFLQHYWVVTRSLKGLPVNEPFVIARLGHDSYLKPFGFNIYT